MTERLRPSRRHGPLPAPLRWSIAAWLAAVAFGVAETLVRLVLPDPPTVGELVARSVVYAVVAVLVLALPSGYAVVRTAVAVLIGGVGTLSLIVEPVQWLAAGGSPAAYLAAADGSTLLIVGLRAAHLVAVLVALIAMFHPGSTRTSAHRRPRCPRRERADPERGLMMTSDTTAVPDELSPSTGHLPDSAGRSRRPGPGPWRTIVAGRSWCRRTRLPERPSSPTTAGARREAKSAAVL